MASVIHRTTLQFKRFANEPDHPEPTWKHNPDMSAVAGVEEHYWKAPADWSGPGAGPVPMTQGEKDAVDAAALAAQQSSAQAQAKALVDDLIDSHMRVVRNMGRVILQSMTLTNTKINDLIAEQGSALPPLQVRSFAALKAALAATIDAETDPD